MVSTDVGVWIAAFFTIVATSYAFRDNIFFRFAEYTFIGAAAGHAIVMGVKNIILYGWTHIAGGEPSYWIPIILGILIYTRYHPQYCWIYRYPIAFLVGIGVGISIRGAIHADFIKQIAATAKPLIATTPLGTLNNIIIFVGTITALTHFIFTYEGIHRGAAGWIPRIGRWMMLAAFGGAFGNTIMTKFSMYQGRIIFLLRDWLGIIH